MLAIASLVGAVGASAAAAPTAPPDAPPGSVTTVRVDDVHDGSAVGSLAPPLYRSWARDLDATVESPLVVDGRVFVATERPDEANGTQLWGLDAADGSTIWGPVTIAAGNVIGGIAADSAIVYVAGASGLLTAFDQTTGHQVWSVQLPGQWDLTSAPTVHHGFISLTGSGQFFPPYDPNGPNLPYGSTLVAVSAADGGLVWTAPIADSDHGIAPPAVTDDGVYVSSGCGVNERFESTTGHPVWTRTVGCEHSGSATPVVHDGAVYVQAPTGFTALDTETGSVEGTLPSRSTPAFAGDIAYDLQAGTLRAIDVTTSQVLWSQAGDGGLTNAPTVIGSEVAASSSTGRVSLVNAQSGVVDWSADTGSPIVGPDEQNMGLDTSLTESGGRLLVPASDTLVAYEHLSADQAFVMALYQDLLGRDVDHGGLAHWVDELNGGRSRASVAVSIAFSGEATKKFISDTYESILHRSADDAGLAYWSSRPGGILHANRILDALYASDEYGVDAGGTDAAWVQALYRDILGRPATTEETSYWSARAESIGRKRVAASIDSSPESADRKVQATYQKLLGRAADDAGLAYFRTYVDRYGTPFVGAVIAGSTEYADRALTRME